MKAISVEKSSINGIDIIKADEWDGEIIRLSRQVFNENSGNPLLNRAGTYIIYADHYDRTKYGNEIYIGQGDDVRQRLKEHLDEKPYWNKILIFTSNKMNIAIAFNIEKSFILRVKITNKYSVMNSNSGQNKKLDDEDFKYTKKYINSALSTLDLAGIDVFSINNDGVYSCSKYRTDASITLVKETTKKVKIIKGSKFPHPRGSKNGFNNLEIKEIVKRTKEQFEFREDLIVDIKGDVMLYIIDESVLLSSFKNNCGVNLKKALKNIENG